MIFQAEKIEQEELLKIQNKLVYPVFTIRQRSHIRQLHEECEMEPVHIGKLSITRFLADFLAEQYRVEDKYIKAVLETEVEPRFKDVEREQVYNSRAIQNFRQITEHANVVNPYDEYESLNLRKADPNYRYFSLHVLWS